MFTVKTVFLVVQNWTIFLDFLVSKFRYFPIFFSPALELQLWPYACPSYMFLEFQSQILSCLRQAFAIVSFPCLRSLDSGLEWVMWQFWALVCASFLWTNENFLFPETCYYSIRQYLSSNKRMPNKFKTLWNVYCLSYLPLPCNFKL